MNNNSSPFILVITDKITGALTNGAQVMARAVVEELSAHFQLKVIVREHSEPDNRLNAEIISLNLEDEELGRHLQSLLNGQPQLVYHFGCTLFSAHAATIVYSLNPAIPLVNHFQLVLPEYARHEGYSESESSELGFYSCFVAERAAANIFPSFSELNRVYRLGWPIQQAANYVVNNAFVPETIAGTNSINGALVNFFAAGRFSDYVKGADLLYRAFCDCYRENPSVHLYIAGDEQRFAGMLNNLPQTACTFLGWLPRTQLLAQMKAADVVVVPSRYEPFGLVAIEAMAMGTPVIAMAIGGLAEIIHHEKTGWLCDPREGSLGLKKAMQQAIVQKNKLAGMGKVSEKVVQDDYALNKITGEIIKILDNTVSAGYAR